jgi:lipoprotein Spr
MRYYLGTLTLFLLMIFCFGQADASRRSTRKSHKSSRSRSVKLHKRHDSSYNNITPDITIATGDTRPEDLITFAQSLLGTRYCFGSKNPERGFDCSGFVNYVFNHFGINIPRSSGDFVSVSGKVDLKDAQFGDLILFTGTHGSRRAGHIGIVVSQPGEPVKFIHSTSGAANGVTETDMNDYYMGRFIKTIRLFPGTENGEVTDLYPATAAR